MPLLPTERLNALTAEHRDLLASLATPEVAADYEKYAELAKRASDIEEAVRAYEEFRAAEAEMREARELMNSESDAESQDFYRTTIAEAEARAEQLSQRITELLLPRDPRDQRNVIVEIRAGAGGEEAALFASDLLRMYQRYAERRGWKTEVLDASHAGVGGLKEVTFEVRGKGAFSELKFESGVHRVQRVPATESSGRIHTSTATVAVLAEADAVNVSIDPDDLKIDTYRSSGPGGQHVNTTDSAVRLTHLPTGLVVACQSERSQRQNRERAMRLLLSKLEDAAMAKAHASVAAERKAQVGTGERSEKIRTYNFPDNRVTDHRIKFTVHGIPQILDGEISDLLDAMRRHATDEQLSGNGN